MPINQRNEKRKTLCKFIKSNAECFYEYVFIHRKSNADKNNAMPSYLK